MKRILALLLAVSAFTMPLCACGGKRAARVNENLDLSEKVTLTICSPWTDFKAIENVSQAFYEKYPNCDIVYEFVQNYEESLVTRLENAPESVDLFLTENIQDKSAFLPYADDLFSHKELDLTDANEALLKNFTYKNPVPGAAAQIYAIPMGGELRGLFVNKTLLASVGLDVPENAGELLEACRVLKEAGYVPMQGNPGMFGQRLMYPYVCNLIANADDYQAVYDRVNRCEEGVSELFYQPMAFLYTLTENYYYNYKYVETELNMFTDSSNEGCARYFFNITNNGEEFSKADDLGTVAFMSGTLSLATTMEKFKADYHSAIEYEFILAPVGDDGGFAYVSPTKGIAVNKNSAHLDWAVEFLNFLFSNEVNTRFAGDSSYIPNTTDSFRVIREKFDIPDNRISDLGQATFDYDFYAVITDSMLAISKANNPKYMDTDENGNAVMYPFAYYMEQLEAAFAAQRENGAQADE